MKRILCVNALLEHNGVPRRATNVAYVKAIKEADGILLCISPETGAIVAEGLLKECDGLLLAGGCDMDPRTYGQKSTIPDTFDPLRDEVELSLARQAIREKTPVLGICRGMQLLNVAAGGTLIQDLSTRKKQVHTKSGPRNKTVHTVAVTRDTRLHYGADALTLRVNSMHHQAVDKLADGMVVSARAPDGVVEAIEMSGDLGFCVGVQWHAEELLHNPHMKSLFDAFICSTR